jgi:hypothetical protein
MSAADLLPDDDSFVRTAIQGLRVPPHLPDFWDHLAHGLDDAFDEMAAAGLMEGSLREAPVPDLAEPEPSPHHVEDPWPEPAHDPHPEPFADRFAEAAVDLFAPVDEPVYEDDDEYEEDRADEAAAYDPAYDEPVDLEPPRSRGPRIFVDAPAAATPTGGRHVAAPRRAHHDRAVVPMSLRRTSNAVLLAVALLAAVMAVVAGLTLVRQRSEDGAPPPSEQASEAAGTILAPRASLH